MGQGGQSRQANDPGDSIRFRLISLPYLDNSIDEYVQLARKRSTASYSCHWNSVVSPLDCAH